jgi:hypothetical protein
LQHLKNGWAGAASVMATAAAAAAAAIAALQALYALPAVLLLYGFVSQVHTSKDAKYNLKASYLEIYNEGVFDLVYFNPKAKSLPVKWDATYGFYVQGLKVVPCSQQRTMMEVGVPGKGTGDARHSNVMLRSPSNPVTSDLCVYAMTISC